MFSCRSCMRRHVHALLGDSVLLRLEQRTAIVPHDHASGLIGRSYSSTSHLRLDELEQGEKVKAQRPSRSRRPANLPTPAAIRQELVYLLDPVKLADHVLNLVRGEKFLEAHSIVQAASKTIQCTVSWNHLIDSQLMEGKVNNSIKLYNEMKKRGQKPDARTYTVLFRGMAERSHYPQTLSKAMSIYHSMAADNAPVKPSIIHTNAILKVCARGKDMDAMLGIVAKLEQRGMNAPDNLTFTTILNAIRQQAVEPAALIDEAQVRALRQRAIMDARKWWVEITERWRQGYIWIDEELTCSMGRILLMGEAHDVDCVFSLIEQTMNIPRLVDSIVTKDTKQIGSPVQEEVHSAKQNDRSAAETESINSIIQRDEFHVIRPPKALSGRSISYAKPGRNSLSLVLEALEGIRLKRPLAAYWDVFTNSHNVHPDSQNYHSYLRNLRALRASSDTVKVLLQMPKSMLEKKTFRIAMSACARDKNNPSCFSNAGKILDLMQQSIADADVPALHKYMEVAMYGSLYSGEPSESPDSVASQFARGRQILRALNRLGPSIINVRSALAYNLPPPSSIKGESYEGNQREAALVLVRVMIGAYDKLINNGMVAPEMHRDLKRERSKLAAFVTRYNHKQPEPAISNRPQAKEGRNSGSRDSLENAEAE